MKPRVGISLLIALLGGGLLLWAGLVVWADETPRASSWQLAELEEHYRHPAPEPTSFRYEGVESCRRCHREPLPEDVASGADKFITLREAEVWKHKDKHALAFAQLLPENNPLAKQMIERLHISDIRAAKECLSCHSNWQHQTRPEQRERPPTDFVQGVTCEACHGPSSAWDKPHRDPQWRTIDPHVKASWGMIDVRNPTVRAQQCFSCHIGNAAEGKVLTHEMYAAGHPPLPSIELETWSHAMPSHGRPTIEKADFPLRKEFLTANPQAVAGDKLHRSRAALLSAIVALRASVEYMAAEQASTTGVPDFALFDCYACHHDLKSPAWRQQTMGVSMPGRPRPASWPKALLPTAMAYADLEDEKVLASLASYEQAFDRRPFGDARLVKQQSATLLAALDDFIAKLEVAPCDQTALRRALVELTKPAPNVVIDFDTARQLAWAIEILVSDVDLPDRDTDQIKTLLARWRTTLCLALPSTQTKSLTDDLAQRWKPIADFDPAVFRRELAEVNQLLTAAAPD